MYQRTEGIFRGWNDFELFFQSWLVEKPVGNIIVTHGISEHSECYDLFAQRMEAANWNIFSWDLRGHGRSEGKRGVIYNFKEYTQDLALFSKFVRKEFPSIPLVLLGHSLGGLVQLVCVLSNEDLDYSGQIMSSPALGISMEVSPLKESLAKALIRFWPQATLSNEIPYPYLTHDQDLVRSYDHDPLRHDRISPKLYFEILNSMEYVKSNSKNLQRPLLLQVSGNDKIVDTKSSVDWFETLSLKDKKLFIYDELYHEIYNELDHEKVYEDLYKWLGEHFA